MIRKYEWQSNSNTITIASTSKLHALRRFRSDEHTHQNEINVRLITCLCFKLWKQGLFQLAPIENEQINSKYTENKQAHAQPKEIMEKKITRQNNDWNQITHRNSIAALNTCIECRALELKGTRTYSSDQFALCLLLHEVKIERW